ncbi:hypothetical protein RE6C_04701 [Rhodopirellula europaea 6C]|uniref:Uncharacterized protein n=1 Tax=Rhodopirellula europaea 6C TaxID=1263867 RepID=M2AWA1_9BACT|nr:hypothetical protein RE6C_04701 [Rhodopirellula europaea 6C]
MYRCPWGRGRRTKSPTIKSRGQDFRTQTEPGASTQPADFVQF